MCESRKMLQKYSLQESATRKPRTSLPKFFGNDLIQKTWEGAPRWWCRRFGQGGVPVVTAMQSAAQDPSCLQLEIEAIHGSIGNLRCKSGWRASSMPLHTVISLPYRQFICFAQTKIHECFDIPRFSHPLFSCMRL